MHTDIPVALLLVQFFRVFGMNACLLIRFCPHCIYVAGVLVGKIAHPIYYSGKVLPSVCCLSELIICDSRPLHTCGAGLPGIYANLAGIPPLCHRLLETQPTGMDTTTPCGVWAPGPGAADVFFALRTQPRRLARSATEDGTQPLLQRKKNTLATQKHKCKVGWAHRHQD